MCHIYYIADILYVSSPYPQTLRQIPIAVYFTKNNLFIQFYGIFKLGTVKK